MGKKLLELRNISHQAASGVHLKNLSFDVKHGENILIFGPEESGISELFEIIIRLNNDFEGGIIYNNRDVRKFNRKELLAYRKDIGYLHGNYGLISNMTIMQNISLPLDYHTKLDNRGVEEFVYIVAHILKLSDCLNKRPFDLTPSQILRTAFARSIILDPDLLYIEHAFDHHCSMNIRIIIDYLKNRSKQPEKSLILVNYSPESYLDLVDKYIMLNEGSIVFEGSKEDFLTTENPFVVQYKNNTLDGPIKIF